MALRASVWTIENSMTSPERMPTHCHGSTKRWTHWGVLLISPRWRILAGYWQVEVDPWDRDKTAFTTFKGLFEFRVMPFGLTGAPNNFQRLMDSVLSGLQFETCLVYLDDIIVFNSTFHEHIARLRQVLSRLRESGLKVKPSKYHLLRERAPFLGHIISREGVATDPGKGQAVTSWPVPTSKSKVRSFLGLVSYCGISRTSPK